MLERQITTKCTRKTESYIQFNNAVICGLIRILSEIKIIHYKTYLIHIYILITSSQEYIKVNTNFSKTINNYQQWTMKPAVFWMFGTTDNRPFSVNTNTKWHNVIWVTFTEFDWREWGTPWNPQSWQSVSQPRFKLATSIIQVTT
jgi:hypothetical protein